MKGRVYYSFRREFFFNGEHEDGDTTYISEEHFVKHKLDKCSTFEAMEQAINEDYGSVPDTIITEIIRYKWEGDTCITSGVFKNNNISEEYAEKLKEVYG